MTVAVSFENNRDFDRCMLLARLRWNLGRAALRCEARLRREGVPVTAGALALAMAAEVSTARSRSSIVPWRLDGNIIDAAIERTAGELVEDLYPC
jgi:hypothetical protein